MLYFFLIMKKFFISIFLILSFSCINTYKNQTHTLENYMPRPEHKKPIALLLYSSFYPQNEEDLGFLSDFTIINVDIEKFPNASSRYFYTKLPCVFFIDSNGNAIFSFDLGLEKEKIIRLLPSIKEEISKSKLLLSKEDVTKNLSDKLISPNEARSLIENFFQNIKNLNKTKNLNFIKQNIILPAMFDKNDENTYSYILFANIKKQILNIDPIFGGMWSENGKIKKLSSFLEFANPTIYFNNFSLKNLNSVVDYNIASSEKYFVSVLYNKEKKLYYPALQYKPNFNLIITEKSLNNIFDQNIINYFEKIFLFSYPQLINGKRFLKIENKINTNIDFTDDKIDKLRNLYVNNINARILKDLFSYPNLLMISFLSLRNENNLNLAIELFETTTKYFSDPDNLIKTHPKGIAYLRDQIAYINSILSIYSVNNDNSFLKKASHHTKLTIENFCKNTSTTMYCSDISFSYLNNYFAYFKMPNYLIEDNANFAKVLIKIYNYNEDNFYLENAHKILSSFYQKALFRQENFIITNSIFTYISSLLNLYTNPIYIYLSNNNKSSKEIIESASKVFNNNFVAKLIDPKVELIIDEDNIFKVKNNEIILCVNKTCEKLKYFKEKNFSDFLEKNYYKTMRVLNY